MLILDDYDQFDGLHWETGSLRNYFAYNGIIAPHTGQPFSEALLMGISGGITMTYFAFHYAGNEPYVRILTRNTFDPLDKIIERLGIQSNVRQTSTADKGVKNLLEVLESGSPAIIYADVFGLPYNAAPLNQGMWLMMPALVFGYDEVGDVVWIADRSRAPLTVTTETLTIARGRTKENKFRILTHEPPDNEKLKSAVQSGIQDCIQLFTQPPPKGSKHNFGFLAFEKWAKVLGKSNERNSWIKMFPPGDYMYAGLTSAFTDICIFGKEGGAERETYANFLDEASVILSLPALSEVGEKFRSSAQAWNDLANTLLPDEIKPFKETKDLMLRRHRLFLDEGTSALNQIQLIDDELISIKTHVSKGFPLDSKRVVDLRESIAEKVLAIRDIELDAVQDLEQAVSSSIS
jgi:hypothetical protein